jgi:hypothetical protein
MGDTGRPRSLLGVTFRTEPPREGARYEERERGPQVRSSDDVVTRAEDDHERVLRRMPTVARLEDPAERPEFWELAETIVRRELAMQLVVYPAISAVRGVGRTVAELEEEQAAVLGRIFHLEEAALDGEQFHREVRRLWYEVREHLASEQAHVIPLLRVAFGDDERVELGRRYRAVSEQAPTPPPATVVPPTNAIVGRLVALAQWIRDATLGDPDLREGTSPGTERSARVVSARAVA